MWWPFKRHMKPTREPNPSRLEALEAQKRTLEAMAEIDRRNAEVQAMSEILRKLRNENHFAESIQNIFRGKA